MTLTRFSLEEPGWEPGDSRDSALGTLFLPILSPVPQLGVDEAPHEPGLGNTHQQQHAESARQGVKVPFLRVKHLVFYPSQSKANGQHSEGEDEETGDPKHSSPGIKPARRGRKGMSALGAPQGTFTPSPEATQSGREDQQDSGK